MEAGIIIQSMRNTYGVFIFGCLLTGLGFGCVYIATTLYVGELAPPILCGSFVGTVTQLKYQLGTLIAF
jgi:MFS family permease